MITKLILLFELFDYINLKSYDLDKISEVLDKYNMDLSIRAEQLPINIFISFETKKIFMISKNLFILKFSVFVENKVIYP